MGIFNIVMSLFMYLIMIGGGYLCKSLTEDEISDFAGYRTTMSRKNKDTWKEANTYPGKILKLSGIIYLVPSLLVSNISDY